MKLGLLFSLFSLFVAGCSSSSGGPDTPVTPEDAGHADSATNHDANVSPDAVADVLVTPDGSGSDGPIEAATVCNSLMNTAPPVVLETIAQDPPAPTGGTVAPGTYFMTAAAIYTGPEGPSGSSGMSQTTIDVTGDTIQMVTMG